MILFLLQISSADIIIQNKNSNVKTLSNQVGKFQIAVKENDTLILSSILFKNQIIIIKKDHLISHFISIVLNPENNELEEIILQDKSYIASINATNLSLPNANKKPLNKLERQLNAYSQQKLPVVIVLTLLGMSGGIDDIYHIISGQRKRNRKLKQLVDQDELEYENIKKIGEIRAYFKDDFFTATLQIPKKHIDAFLQYCLKLNIIFLFEHQRYLEITDVFITHKNEFLKQHG